MRKMVLELELKSPFKEMFEQATTTVESYNLIELVRLDFERGVKVGIMEVNMKEGFTIDDLNLPPPAEVVSVIQGSGRTYTCLVQVQTPKEMMSHFKDFDIDVIWDAPMGFIDGKMVLSVVGEDEELRKLVKVVDAIGTVEEMHVQPASFHRDDMLASLTERQREIVIEAKRRGYYDYPRRINSEQLAERVGVSKATVVEHLRKAEGRLMGALLAGY
jgi:predicted DNA binding protein